MIIRIPQEVICTCDYDYEIPNEIVKQGKEAVKAYIIEHYGEIPVGEIEIIENSYTLSEDILDERIDEAFDCYYRSENLKKGKSGIITKAANIKWDIDTCIDEEGNEIELPTVMIIPPEIADDEDRISNYLSDQTGFCHEGYQIIRIDTFLDKKIAEIKKQEEKYGVKINIYRDRIIDTDHLDCIWYGGDVGSIQYKGYEVVIGAYGDIRAYGKINGIEVSFKDKSNSGSLYQNLAIDYKIDDKKFYELIDSPSEENYLSMEDNNWFEFDLISPNGEFVDLAGCDNVIDNNLLENFDDISNYLEYIDYEIQDSRITDIIQNKKDLDVFNKLDNLCGDGTLSNEEFELYRQDDMVEKIEKAAWELMTDVNSKFSKASYYDGLAIDYEDNAANGYDLWTANVYNCDELYIQVLKNIK